MIITQIQVVDTPFYEYEGHKELVRTIYGLGSDGKVYFKEYTLRILGDGGFTINEIVGDGYAEGEWVPL